MLDTGIGAEGRMKENVRKKRIKKDELQRTNSY